MEMRRICILGGAGFVGRALAARLTREGYLLRVPTRHRESRRHNMILLPTLELVEADVHAPAALRRLFEGCQAVVNLVGILNERGHDGAGFYRAHTELARRAAETAQESGIKRFVQMSALNADPGRGRSYYLRSKGQAEAMLPTYRKLQTTIFRPSVIFGPQDRFFNRFARLLRVTPLAFPLACPRTRFAPVYVNDVAEAIARTLTRPDSYGQNYGLCGPRRYTLLELVQYTARCIGVRRRILPLSPRLSYLQALAMEYMPGKPFSIDNYRSARNDSVCPRADLEALGIQPTPLESVVPEYLARHSRQELLDRFRRQAARDPSHGAPR
ncbi:MAG: complex I NDUFA9 subunit family protein [Gammaproteobacteria bacterium]|nr:complex I NDUFA9 subunit family protein [Gammaproteobacteria bacterium]MDD9825039.1 complex I NDUFA9 subunit family protein [Gammaproteobacteria bacterium]MDD9864324.1 complex I NDUFA9 subunit family protein [Gammaproteobacteria bacterium]